MTRKRYLNVEIEGQDNIGVIDLGEISMNQDDPKIAEEIYSVVSEKLGKVIEEHFDNDVDVLQIVIVSLSPIKANGKVRILDSYDLNECSIEEVTLSETWLY